MVSYNLEKDIINELKKNPKLSILKLAYRFNCSESTIQNYIEELKADGRIKRVGGGYGGHWEVCDGEM